MAATALTLNSHSIRFTSSHRYPNTHSRLSPPSIVSTPQRQSKRGPSSSIFTSHRVQRRSRLFFPIVNQIGEEPGKETTDEEEEVNSAGVKAALSMLRFYKSEISPLLPRSCRYVPSCSEYSMIAYKKYGVVKGTILTAWRLCRCNPLGGSGFDPPRWFDEKRPSEQ